MYQINMYKGQTVSTITSIKSRPKDIFIKKSIPVVSYVPVHIILNMQCSIYKA